MESSTHMYYTLVYNELSYMLLVGESTANNLI